MTTLEEQRRTYERIEAAVQRTRNFIQFGSEIPPEWPTFPRLERLVERAVGFIDKAIGWLIVFLLEGSRAARNPEEWL